MKQFFTFGPGHVANDGTRMGERYVVIEGETFDDIRREMFHKFGARWGYQYSTLEGAGAEEYQLTEYVIPETQIYRHNSDCIDTCESCLCICHHGGTHVANKHDGIVNR
jgi:hypothetical protein